MAENHDKMSEAMGTKLEGLEALNNETVDLVSMNAHMNLDMQILSVFWT